MFIWRRQWHPTPVLLPGKSHGQKSLVGCSPWGSLTDELLKKMWHMYVYRCICIYIHIDLCTDILCLCIFMWVCMSAVQFSSLQFSLSVVSDYLQPHEPQHARPPCPSPTPVVHPNPCPLSHWCHPIISSSIVPFSYCPQTCPVSGSFPMSQFFPSCGQITGVSVSTSVLTMYT